MSYQNKLSVIREKMIEIGVDAYIIPSSDPHMSEYVPDRYMCISFASGFTGSSGTLVITQNFAGLWADFRYFEQATQQLEGSGYELVKLKIQYSPEYITWLYDKLPSESVVAFDYKLMSMVLGQEIKAALAVKQIAMQDVDVLEHIWTDRPTLPTDAAVLLSEIDCGESFKSKLFNVRAAMQKSFADVHLISSLDDLAWLFNLRGNDVRYNPVVLCYALITAKEVVLYINKEKLCTDDLSLLVQKDITLKSYEEIIEDVQELQNCTILLDGKRTCYQLFTQLSSTLSLIEQTNPAVFLKAIKNKIEIKNTRIAMLSDGVALTRFFKWLEENIGKQKVTELTASEKIKEFRAIDKTFVGVSFASIAGYGPHAALPHYCVDETSDIELLPNGLFLLDSGGHYRYGTTDVTRTVPLGETTYEEKLDYTLVLSAMIFGSAAKFPKGTRGYQIDGICRQQLWQQGINYGHGTGHGVGYYLNVHEGPQNIGPSNAPVAIETGMITSIEPGIYRPGKHGVRIENLVLAVAGKTTDFGDFLQFETITLAHIDTSTILKEWLRPEQIKWLNSYNQMVYNLLKIELSGEEALWLKEKCKAI